MVTGTYCQTNQQWQFRKGKDNWAQLVQMRCTRQCSLIFFHAEPSIVLNLTSVIIKPKLLVNYSFVHQIFLVGKKRIDFSVFESSCYLYLTHGGGFTLSLYCWTSSRRIVATNFKVFGLTLTRLRIEAEPTDSSSRWLSSDRWNYKLPIAKSNSNFFKNETLQ